MSDRPIGDHALLSDCHTAALVTSDGSVDWLPMPRFDAPSIFGRLLDDEAGHFRIAPRDTESTSRAYLEGTLVLRTRFETPTGSVVLEDALATGPNGDGHQLGAESPHALVRRVRCVRGEVELEIEYAPRPEYGLVRPLLHQEERGILARGGASVLMLTTPFRMACDGSTAQARISLAAGEEHLFVLEHRTSSDPRPEPWSRKRARAAFEESVRAWRAWSELHQSYDGPWKEAVHLSGRILQGLTHHPTGAIVAAPTTSLPETIGGERNWDYRYTWVRDASFTLDALWVAACPDEAHRFFDFLAHSAFATVSREQGMQIMFGIGGEHDLSERVLPHLSGWRDSRPVRVGNGAWDQRQLDVYGELLDAAHRLRDQLRGRLHPVTRRFLADVADGAARRWQEVDRGIWEVRGPERHFVYSKLMCWVALDRAIRLADLLDARDRVPRWQDTRDEIREAILTRGWSDEVGAYTQTFGGASLDASNLVMPIVGFVEAEDPRMLGTLEAIEAHLTDERGLVYRYRTEDGLEGEEGTFLLCTFWLAQALALAGRTERAREVFERAASHANDLGLLAEEVTPDGAELLGNFPQAFSHIGLVNAAWAISQAERG